MEGRCVRARARVALAAVVAALAVAEGRVVGEQAPLDGPSTRVENVRFEAVIDNDLFAARGHDRDYTGGFSVTLPRVPRPLRRLGDWLERADAQESGSGQTARFGLLVFTPEDIGRADPIADDRPYANLLYVGISQYALGTNEQVLRQSTVTLGVLGTAMAQSLQSAVHRSIDTVEPRGFSHQISDGGEISARFAVARHRMLAGRSAGGLRFDAKLSTEGSVGYLTEAVIGVGARFGKLRSPWWGSIGDLSDYAAQPALPARSGAPQWFAFGGAKVRLRPYNAFLRGQVRHSDVEVSRDNIRQVLGQAWIGVAIDTGRARLGYVLRFQTAELRRGRGARESIWGGLAFARSFD